MVKRGVFDDNGRLMRSSVIPVEHYDRLESSINDLVVVGPSDKGRKSKFRYLYVVVVIVSWVYVVNPLLKSYRGSSKALSCAYDTYYGVRDNVPTFFKKLSDPYSDGNWWNSIESDGCSAIYNRDYVNEDLSEIDDFGGRLLSAVSNGANDIVDDVIDISLLGGADFKISEGYTRLEYIHSPSEERVVAYKGKRYTSGNSDRIVKLLGEKGKTRTYLMADGSIIKRIGGTLSWRVNSQGNLKTIFKGDRDHKTRSTVSRKKSTLRMKKLYSNVVALGPYGEVIFSTPYDGKLAAYRLLKYKYGNYTFPRMIRKYAVSDYSGKANHGRYVKKVYDYCDSKGINIRGKKLKDLSDREFGIMMSAMKKREVWREGKTVILRRAGNYSKESLSKYMDSKFSLEVDW